MDRHVALAEQFHQYHKDVMMRQPSSHLDSKHSLMYSSMPLASLFQCHMLNLLSPCFHLLGSAEIDISRCQVVQ